MSRFLLVLACFVVFLSSQSASAGVMNVAVFDNGSYVDTSGGATAESDAIQASLASLGHSVSTFVGFGASDWASAGTANDLILIPEQEISSLAAALSPSAQSAIANYVSGGGGLIVMGGTSSAPQLLNDVFGYSLTYSASLPSSPQLSASAAMGTPYASGVGNLPLPSFTSGVFSVSLPAGARNLYSAGGETAVFTNDVGQGRVGYLGWDWFNAQPLGSVDSGWLSVLDTSVMYVGAGSAPPPPTVPEAGSLAVFGMLGVLGLGAHRRRRR